MADHDEPDHDDRECGNHRPPWAPTGPPRHGHHGPPWGRGGPPPGFRRRILRRVAIVGTIAIAAVIGLATLWWNAAQRWRDHRPDGPGPWEPGNGSPLIGLVVLTVVLVGLALLVGRRFAAPLADVMEAAEQLRLGTTDIRVRPRGPRDVRRLATAFNAMVERLETDETRRRALLADLAHELRTPLAVVRGNVEGMLDGVYERDDRHLAIVVDEVAVMERLLEDLTTLSTAEAGALRLDREEVTPADLVELAARGVADRARAADVTVHTDVTAAPTTLEVDTVRMQQVLGNLLGNAIRHTPAGGRVDITVAAAGDDVQLTVADTGPGIDPRDLRHVFDRFVRAADSGGSGLGLAIARQLVEAHGGTITAGNRPTGGTVITIDLPMVA